MAKQSPPVKVKASELVLDFSLYPRQQVDSQHVHSLILAREAGAEFPPIIADSKSKRVIDGFHRVRTEVRLHKDKAEVRVEFRDYADEQAMLLDAMRLNAAHGRNLTTYDRSHAIILADNLGLSHDAVADALGMTVDRVGQLSTTRSAKAGGLTVPIKRTIRHMAGKRLTKGQQDANRKLGGMDASFYARQLILLLENKLIDEEDEELVPILRQLSELLETMLVAQ